MGLVRFAVYMWVSVWAVLFRRLLRGPRLPSWSFGYEVVTEAQRRFAHAVGKLSLIEQRRAWGALEAKSAALRQVQIERGSLGGVPVVWFSPKLSEGATVVMYLHGGSFIYGSERSHGDLAARLALASSACVVFPLYRLAPEHPFPAAVDDARAVYQELLERHSAERVIVAGDSAGGNLTLALLLALRAAGARLPNAAIVISPWVDLAARGGSLITNSAYDWAEPQHFQSWSKAYRGSCENERDPRVSPAHAELQGLPPLLMVYGGAEMLFDQLAVFAKRARDAGVPLSEHVEEERVHLWMANAPFLPDCQRAIDVMGAYVKSRTAAA